MNHHEQENWQQADARVLGQILAAQNIIFALPDTTRIAEFYVQTLISIPGIAACRVCLGGRSAPSGEMDTSVCEQCEVLHLAVGEGSSFAPVDSNFMCSLIGQPDIRCIAINSYQHHFGFFVIKIKDAAVLDVYYPFIVNLSNYLAITLENRWQKDLLQKAHAELERKVEERTHDLTVANVELQREITHRQRAEEALSEQYSTLRSIIDSANAHIFSLDREYCYTSFNQGHAAVMKAIYGAEIETGQSLLGYMIVAEDREAAKRNLDRALAGEQIVEEAYSGEELLSRRYFQVSHSPIKTETDDVIGVAVLAQDITERKQAEEEQLAHLRFFEHLDQVNRVIQGTNDLEQMMGDVLDVVLSVFDSDRAFLIYPCDPEADTWMVPVERTRPEYLGVSMSGLEMPVDAEVAAMLRILRDSDRPVKFGPDSRYPLPAKVAKRFGFHSFLSTALYPKAGKPWLFGIHQCSHLRTGSQEEERLLQEIGQRLADALTSLLTYRRVQESERELQQSNDLLRAIIEAAPTAIVGLDLDGNVQLVWNPAAEKMLGWTAQEAMGHLLPSVPVDSHEEFRRFRNHIRSGESLSGVDVRRQRRDGLTID
jgi:PAS domain S-box-containing protein